MNNQTAIITVFTIGHSSRPIDKFITLVKFHSIELVVDVRTIPKSGFNPQFNGESLKIDLHNNGVSYLHSKGLGGFRHAQQNSINMGWQAPGFRGYADYMQTHEFETNLLTLIERAKLARTVIMCAEAVPWRCHRSLISDALSVRGIKVIHIMSAASARGHTITPWAVVKGVTITYPKQ